MLAKQGMSGVNKKNLSERDICTEFVKPALVKPGWDLQTQIREEVNLAKGRVIVSGRITKRGESKRADDLIHCKPNLPLAIIEAKDNDHAVGAGRQQAPGCADILKAVPDVARRIWTVRGVGPGQQKGPDE
jgi:type I restriction enzyme R subunit